MSYISFFGLMYAMCTQQLSERRCFWGTVSNGLFPAPKFGKRFGMSRQRFEEILMALSFTPERVNDSDKWFEVRPLVQMLNEKWQSVFAPGYKITVDESMFSWYGRGTYFDDGMPAVIKIKRKPKGVGCEAKTIADSQTNIMIGLELNEGKNDMSNKKWQRQFDAGTATTLRLTEPWHGSGRIVVGGSWFSSVKTAVELSKCGLFYIGMLKTAHWNFPLKKLTDETPPAKGSSVVAVAKVDNTDLYAISWRDRKVHTFISSCGTTLSGTPARKRRYDECGSVCFKEILRPKIVETYFDGAPSIDIHNHIRQSGLALEQVWKTHKWTHRIFASLLGVIETNAF